MSRPPRDPGPVLTADVLVVGAGLIGTSVALALHGRAEVLLADVDDAVVVEALARGAGRRWDGQEQVRLAVVCTPPSAVAPTVQRLQAGRVARSYTHVSSVQAPVQAALAAAGCDLVTVCGGHPMAGRERGGPGAALGTLFAGRPWALCPEPVTGGQAVADLEQLVAQLTGENDALVAAYLALRPADDDSLLSPEHAAV